MACSSETGGYSFQLGTVRPYPRQHEFLLKYTEQELKDEV